MTLAGLFAGLCLGLTLSAEAAVQWFPAVLMALVCGVGSWMIQEWAEGLFSQHRSKLWIALVFCVVWIVLSLLAGVYPLHGWLIAAQLLCGLMSTFGGRRTPDGHQAMSEALGLRRYLFSVSRSQLQHICQQNPEYFHTMAPFALALGVDKAFAARFGRSRIPACPYITGAPRQEMSAAQWSQFMRRTVQRMEARQKQMPLEKLTDLVRSFTR